MTRTPRLSDNLRNLTGNLRSVQSNLSRKTLVYAGAGLALAGTGAATATAGFPGTTASAAGPGNVGHAVVAAARQHHAPASSHGKDAQAPAKHRAKHPAKHPVRHPATGHARTWAAVSRIVAGQSYPKAGHGALPAQDRLTPVGTSGPQSWLPITPTRYDNAKTIVRQALAKHMGVRAAVIAVATSMQESTLLNVNYGTSDSLGLFQQRPSMGWGTPSQICEPKFAADAFLNALRTYQVNNPGWAHQPLWQPAQSVQGSAFPYAYAKWEAQAAHLVASVTEHIV